jgi:Flp pilus assembly protein TadG
VTRSGAGAEASRDDRGQASVEFALALPLLAVMALGLVVIGMAIRHEIAVEVAAREGARAAAVSADAAGAASVAARRAVDLPIEVSTIDEGATVSVTVTYTDPVDVAIIGWMIGPITHSATVTMSVEPP